MIKDLISIAFPNNCIGCNEVLLKGEEFICLKCNVQIPFCEDYIFNSSDWLTHPGAQLSSLFFYDKKGITQSIIHQIKYGDNTKLAKHLGERLGSNLKVLNIKFNAVIPVPLHPKRKKQRGYNQAEEIAKGIGIILDVSVNNKLLTRIKNTKTQTNKDKDLREQNISNAFCLNKKVKNYPQNILLVDDVITTGATINECLKTLNKIPNINVFVVSLGIVKF